MERSVLHTYARYSPRESTSPWRCKLRAIFFARTHSYIEDFRQYGETNMMTLAAMDVEDAVAAGAGGALPSMMPVMGAIRRGSRALYGRNNSLDASSSQPRDDSGAIDDALIDSEAFGIRRSHRRKSSVSILGGGIGDDDDDEEEEERRRLLLEAPLLSSAADGGGGAIPTAPFILGPDDLLHRNKAPLESTQIAKGEEKEAVGGKKKPQSKTIQRKYDLGDFITLFLVILNAAFLAVWDPLAPQEGILPHLDLINNVFTFLFFIDLSLHVVCMGFVIFRADSWYIFDALVVIAGVISSILELTMNLSTFALGALRAFRVVSLLRSARTFETLRIIVKTILGTILRLKHLILLFILFLLVFGIAAVSQYSSRLRTRCVHDDYWNATKKQLIMQQYYANDIRRRGVSGVGGGGGEAGQYNGIRWNSTHLPPADILPIAGSTTDGSVDETIHGMWTWGTVDSGGGFPNPHLLLSARALNATELSNPSLAAKYFKTHIPRERRTFIQRYFHNSSVSPTYNAATNLSFDSNNIRHFIKFQQYDLFSDILKAEYHLNRVRAYACRDELYSMTRHDFEADVSGLGCAAEFNNSVQMRYATMGIDGATNNSFTPPFPYMTLLSLPAPEGEFYRVQKAHEEIRGLDSWESVVWREQTCDPSDALFLFGYRCPSHYRCEMIANPQNGHIGFDNLGLAMLTLFVAVTFEGWYHTMTWTMCGVDPTAALFFIVVVTIGALFITNLAVVELTVQYEIRIKEEWRFQNERKLRLKYETSNWVWALYDKFLVEIERNRRTDEEDEDLEDDIDSMPLVDRITYYTRQAVKHHIFKLLVTTAIVSNIVILGMYSSTSGKTYENLSMVSHFSFVAILAVELIMRLIAAESLWQFIVDGNFLNCVDVVAFCFGLIDVFANETINCRPAMALRLTRLVWELAHYSATFHRWVMVVIRTLKASIVIGVLLLILIFLFGVVGLYLFGGTFCNMYESDIYHVLPDNTSPICPMRPRANYDTIASAMLTTLIIASVDGWDQIMYNGIDARGPIFSFYFIAVLLICKYLVVNLLIGIFLHEATLAQHLEDEKILQQGLLDDRVRGLARTKREKVKDMLSDFFATPEQAKVDELDPRYSKFQLRLQVALESTAFKVSMVVLTFISCFCVAMESPLRAPDTKEEALLLIADVTSNAVFALEAVAKIIAYGFILGKQSYIRRDPWNLFDFLVVAISFVSQGLLFAKKGDRTQPVFSALRVLRAVRPVRFASRTEGFRILFKAVQNSFKSLFFLFFMLFSLATLWSVMGVQWFAGAYGRCSNLAYTTEVDCLAANVRSVTSSVAANSTVSPHVSPADVLNHAQANAWIVPYNNFDSISQAYMSLLAISTTENWADIMFNGMDASGRGKGPVVNEGKRFAIYFAAFVTIGGMYFVALLISVLIRSYQEAKRSFPTRNYFLNPHEQAWTYSHNDLLSMVPLVDYDSSPTSFVEKLFIPVRTYCRKIERSPLFDLLVYCMIIVGFIVAAVDHYPKSSAMADFISISSLLFAVAFCVEMAIRMVSEGMNGFFKSQWNRFDLLVTMLNLFGIVLELAWSQSTFVTVFRLLRAIRMLRMVRKSRTLQSVLKRILLALYALKNTVAVLFLIYFIFGVMGMRMFGRVAYGVHINQRQNFNDIINSMLIMFRCSTGGEWLQLVEAISQKSPHCDPNLDECITPAIAQTYFVVFEIIAQYIFINLFTSVIFDIFTETDEVALTVSSFEASQFIKLWTCFDPEGTYRIESRYLVSFLRGIPRQCILSLGPIAEARRRQMEMSFLKKLDVNELNGKVELQDLIVALLQRYYQEMMLEKRNKIRTRQLKLQKLDKDTQQSHDDKANGKNGSGAASTHQGKGGGHNNSGATAINAKASGGGRLTNRHGLAPGGTNLPNAALGAAAADVKPTLSHDTDRALRRHADRVFRKEARDLHRPPGDGHHVAKRYAINIIEHYFVQSKARRAEQMAIAAEVEEMRSRMDKFQRDLERKTQREIDEAKRSSGNGGVFGSNQLRSNNADDSDMDVEDGLRRAAKGGAGGKKLWQRVRGKLIANAKAQQQRQELDAAIAAAERHARATSSEGNNGSPANDDAEQLDTMDDASL